MVLLSVFFLLHNLAAADVNRPCDHHDYPGCWKKHVRRLAFTNVYHATGTIRIPHGEIEEPFEVWYDKPNHRSRIDYYHGMDVLIRRGDLGRFGAAFKLVPQFSERSGTNYVGCQVSIGRKTRYLTAQSILPSTDRFKFSGFSKVNGRKCLKWIEVIKAYGKVNNYTMYELEEHPGTPVRYEMNGFDTLLNSYYDQYIIDYDVFERWTPNNSIFSVPETCITAKKGRQSIHTHLNPLEDFFRDFLLDSSPNRAGGYGQDAPSFSSSFEDRLDNSYKYFSSKHGRVHRNVLEREKRKHTFRHSVRFINSKNRQGASYKLAVNPYSDLGDDEFEKYKGILDVSKLDHDSRASRLNVLEYYNFLPVPRYLDWRKSGAVGPVHSQGICGSCYAFAVAGALEAAHFLQTGEVIDLSEQQILDCSWGFGNKGCKGGFPHWSLDWISTHRGLATQDSYGRYLAQEGFCHFENITIGVEVASVVHIPTGNWTLLKQAVSVFGPVPILLNSRPLTFKFYSRGIYDDPKCDLNLDHAALLVGYGHENGRDYWIVKNSWSTLWGEDGYIRIAVHNNICGVASKPVVPLISRRRTHVGAPKHHRRKRPKSSRHSSKRNKIY